MTAKRYKKLLRALVTKTHEHGKELGGKGMDGIGRFYKRLDMTCGVTEEFHKDPTLSYQSNWDALKPWRDMYGM